MCYRIAVLTCLGMLAAAGGVGAQGVPKVTDTPPHPERVLMESLGRILWFGPDHAAVKATEASAMLATILKGGAMGNGDGWFRPGASRYGWKWLAARHVIGEGGAIARKDWRGPPALFFRLDRDRNGVLTAADFDWSGNAKVAREENVSKQWFARIDTNADGRISRNEWDAFFAKMAAGKGFASAEAFQQALTAAVPATPKPAGPKVPQAFQQIMVKGFMTSELGSPFEGPRVNQPAPDFTLATHDGSQKITLSEFRGKKPVVLIFGSVT